MLWGISTALSIVAPLFQSPTLPFWKEDISNDDWLVHGSRAKANVFRTDELDELVLANGLVARRFRLSPNAATIGLRELTQGSSLVRAASPEAFVKIDGASYDMGGLDGQPDLGYLTPDWIRTLTANKDSFAFTGFEVGRTEERLQIARKTGDESPHAKWPPPGVSLTLHFSASAGPAHGVQVNVRYELYDGMPIFEKSLTIQNNTGKTIHVDSFALEKLRTTEPESLVEDSRQWLLPNITVLTDYSFGGMEQNSWNQTVYWDTDPQYTTQVNYALTMPCVLRIAPPLGPAVDLKPGEKLNSFHAFEIIHDSWDRERKGLEIRQAYRALAPWILDNPLMLHLTSTDPKVVHTAMDQAAEVGFEMVIFSFGSGLDMEDVSEPNIAKFRGFADYAHSKELRVGGYSLLASRRIDDENDVVDPKTGKTGHAIFGNSPCLGSKWASQYFSHLKSFLERTGFDLLEHDGSYPGDVCASTSHPGHKGLEDSQWQQFQVISEFYRWCRERGIFLNVPDNYMLSGSNKTGMGYREDNWSLPRAQQHIHARQNLYDGTWLKPPSMGWMFVPLVEYHGGGAAATIEPLHEHLADYEKHLVNNLAFGAQACYRGPRLYDSVETKELVAKWVAWFKAHRSILESDVIHLRRADGVHLDGVLHVGPGQAMMVVWNPTSQAQSETWDVPLYYTGLTSFAKVARDGGSARTYRLRRDYSVRMQVDVPANGFAWYTIG